MLVWWVSTICWKIGLGFISRVLNNGHWFDYKALDAISCTCGLESAYWNRMSHKVYLDAMREFRETGDYWGALSARH